MIALLTSTQPEAYHTIAKLENPKKLEWGGGRFFTGSIDGIPVVAGWTGTGTTLAAMSSQFVCSRFQPAAIFFAGIGGSLKDSYEEGQILTAGDVLQWDLEAGAIGIGRGIFPGEKNDRNTPLSLIPTDDRLRRALLRLGQGEIGETRFLSGNRFLDLSDPASLPAEIVETAADLDAGLVDMESIGPALVGYFNGVPVLLLRIVADSIAGGIAGGRPGGRPENYRSFVDRASRKIASLFHRMLGEVS